MAENIDELQIEIESDATSALDGLDSLAKSLEKLKKAVAGSSETAKGIKDIASALKSLGKIDNLNLTANVTQLKKLSGVIGSMQSNDFASFRNNIDAVHDGMTKLSSVQGGDISTVSAGMKALVKAYQQMGQLNLDFGPQLSAISGAVSSMSTASEGLNKVDFSNFKANIVQLSQTLQPLQGFKSQAASLLNALRGFPETASALNSFTDFSSFGQQVQALANSLAPLSAVNSKLGATLDAMSRVTQVSNSVNSVNFKSFGAQVTELAAALTPLQNVNTKLGATLNNLSRVGTVSQELAITMSSTALADDINKLVNALSGLNTVGKNGLSSTVSALKQIPKITASLDPATLEDFSVAMQKLTEIMGPLAAKMEEIGRGFSMLPDKMKAAIKASDQMEAANKRSGLSFKNLSEALVRTIKKYAILGFAFKRVWTMFGGWFNESNEYIESLNLFKVTMGSASAEALEFAETVQDLMGIDISQWIQNQGVFMQMATGFGIANDQAEVMSRNLTQLAYDMSSFFNTDVGTAMQKLQSGLSGQIKGLKAFGINLSVAALQETALSLGIDQSVRSMTEAQKAQLRYITIMQRSQNIMGDMGRTIATPANAMRILSAQMTQLKRALGDIVSVLVAEFIPYIQAFVKMMTEAANSVATFFGFELPEIDYSGLDVGSEAFEGMDEGIDGTSQKLKELKKQLMGFDELNILKSNKDDDDSDIGASYDLGVELPEYDFLKNLEVPDLGPMVEKLKDVLWYAGAISAALTAWKLTGLLKDIGVAKVGLSTMLGSALALGGAILEAKGLITTFTEGLDTESFVEILLGGGGIVAGGALIGKSLGSALLGGAIGGIIAGVPAFIAGVYDSIVNGIDWLSATLTAVGATAAGAGIGAIIGTLGGPIGAGIGALIGLAVGALTDLTILVCQNWDEIVAWSSEALTSIGQFFSDTWSAMGELASAAWEGVKTVFASAASWFNTTVIEPISNYFRNLWDGIVTKVSEVWQKIQSFFSNITSWISSISSSISGLGSRLSSRFSSVSRGGLSSGIRFFADGGYPTSGDMFIANEAGPEYVGRIGNKTAVANNDQITAGIASAVYEAMMAAQSEGGGNKGGTARIIVQIGERAVGEAAVEYVNGQIRQTGTNPINY